MWPRRRQGSSKGGARREAMEANTAMADTRENVPVLLPLVPMG